MKSFMQVLATELHLHSSVFTRNELPSLADSGLCPHDSGSMSS
jgi:hypothetical protein